MAGDIAFNQDRAWTAQGPVILGLLDRAIRMCGSDEALLVSILLVSKETQILDIELAGDGRIQRLLTRRMLEASQEWLNELRADPATSPNLLNYSEQLVNMARLHLGELSR